MVHAHSMAATATASAASQQHPRPVGSIISIEPAPWKQPMMTAACVPASRFLSRQTTDTRSSLTYPSNTTTLDVNCPHCMSVRPSVCTDVQLMLEHAAMTTMAIMMRMLEQPAASLGDDLP